MDLVQYHIESAEDFWLELDDLVKENRDASLSEIDYALKTYIHLAAQYYDQYISSEIEVEHCISLLLDSWLLDEFSERCTNLLLDLLCSPQSGSDVMHLALSILSKRAQEHNHVCQLMRQSRRTGEATHRSPVSVMLCIIEQYGIDSIGSSNNDEASHSARERLGLEATRVLYDVCRVSRLEAQELSLFTEPFIRHLFHLVESTRDGDEVFNFALIRLIIALNEQFMVASVTKASAVPSSPGKRESTKKSVSVASSETNVVLQTMKSYLGLHKTFGENLIFILNRCDGGSPEDLCVSLLILKILYLLFTTPSTSEYFYTNDLCVLVDVFLRELNDLPEESEGLRHTYLRVLHPLLTNTQLKSTLYKRRQIRRALQSLVAHAPHRKEASTTTRRLVERNLRAPWCTELAEEDEQEGLAVITSSPISETLSPQAIYYAPNGGAGLGFGTHHTAEGAASVIFNMTRDQESDRRGSTLSVNSVAGASTPNTRHQKKSSLSASATSQDRGKQQQPFFVGQSTAGISLGHTAPINPAAAFVRDIVHQHDAVPGVTPVAALVQPSPKTSLLSTIRARRPPPPTPSKKKKDQLVVEIPVSIAREQTGQIPTSEDRLANSIDDLRVD